MQTLLINFYQRIMLAQLIGNFPASDLREASVYLRILEKIRLADAEILDTQFLASNGSMSWRLPTDGYGSRTLELESDEVGALIVAIQSPAPVKIVDAEWMVKMVEELKRGANVNTTC